MSLKIKHSYSGGGGGGGSGRCLAAGSSTCEECRLQAQLGMRAGYHGQHSQVQHINRAEERGEDGPSREAGGAGLGTGRTLFPGSLAGDFD